MLTATGTVFTVGKPNANGWAIPEGEVEHAITSLKSSVVRICNSRDEHACDRDGDRYAEIGQVADAWREGEQVIAKANITDSEAARKLKEGTWKPTWSLFGTGDNKDDIINNLNIESLTVVRRPAFKEAKFTLAGSEEHLIIEDTGDTPSEDTTIETSEGSEMSETEEKKEDVKASEEKVEQPIQAAEPIPTEPETFTEAEMDKKVEAAVNKAKTETLEHLAKQDTTSHIVEAMQKAGALKPEEVESRTEQLMKLETDVLASELTSWQTAAKNIEASNKFENANLSNDVEGGLSVGRWNNDTKEWVS